MKRSTLVYTAVIVVLTIVFMAFNGCETLRKAPTEAQKQTAQMAVDSTTAIRLKGSTPQSAVSIIANESSKANQTYFGLPVEPLAPPEAVIPQAQSDAAERPDPWETVDTALAIGLAAASLFTGVGGVKIAKAISIAQQKSKALRQIVIAQQNFRDELKASADNDETVKASEILQSLKDKNKRTQTPSTMTLVTEVKGSRWLPSVMPTVMPTVKKVPTGEPTV